MSIYSNILKNIYSLFLDEFDFSQIRDFWQNNLYQEKSVTLQEHETYSKLWNADSKTSFEYLIKIMNSLETFLLSNNITLTEFYEKLSKTCRFPFVPANLILTEIKPYLYAFYKFNTTATAFNLIYRLFRRYCINMNLLNGQTIFYKVNDKEANDYILQINYDDIIIKKIYFDLNTLFFKIIDNILSVLNMPDFKYMKCIHDVRPVYDILNGFCDNIAINPDFTFTINDKIYGRIIDAADKTENSFNHELHSKERYFLNKTITISEDYYCPIRKRIVLHKGCTYNSPFYLFLFSYDNQYKIKKQFLSEVIIESPKESSLDKHIIKHKQLLKICTKGTMLNYNKTHQKISINNKHLISGIPAKILRKIINAYLFEGRKEFSYHEFRNDPELNLDIFKPNLDVRINRLITKLHSECNEISLEKKERGKITLNVDGTIDLIEN